MITYYVNLDKSTLNWLEITKYNSNSTYYDIDNIKYNFT